MSRTVAGAAPGQPDCDECAARIAAIIADRSLQASFRPIADFARCEIFGYVAAARGPAAMLGGTDEHLFGMAQRFDRVYELARAMVSTLVARFTEHGATGLLFLPLPQAAAAELCLALAETVFAAVDELAFPVERTVILFPAIGGDPSAGAVEFASRLRSCGFQLAATGVCCALTERLLWSRVPPDFVFFAAGTFDGLDLATVRDDEVPALIAAMAATGRRIVADGIDSGNEFKALQRLGIDYGAGDFFGRGSRIPTRAIPAAAHKAIAAACGCATGGQRASGGVLERLLVHVPPVASRTRAEDVFMLFEADAALRAVAVVEDDVPRGLISRYEMIDNMARPYRHELYGRKPCTRFMDAQPLVVDIGVSLADLSELVVGADPRHLISGFIVTERGRYLGMGSVQDLVREVTSMQMEAAKYANPLTQLPGNVPINQYIDNLLAAGESCCIAYCDLDHFKPFNDVYGYAKGDEVIQLTARVLGEALDAEADFLGHVGGDDFVMVLRGADWERRCHSALARFGEDILAFFSNDDIERGGYITENRKGQLDFHRLTSLSIGAVEALPGMFQNHLQVSIVAAEVKKRAKAIAGNSLYVNRRTYHNETGAAPHEAAPG